MDYLTSSSDCGSSLPSCSTEYSNCLNDEQKLKFSRQLTEFHLNRQLTTSDNDEKVQTWLDHSDHDSDNSIPASSTLSCQLCHMPLNPVPSSTQKSTIVHQMKLCRSAIQPMIHKLYELIYMLNSDTEILSDQPIHRFHLFLDNLDIELEALQTQFDEQSIEKST